MPSKSSGPSSSSIRLQAKNRIERQPVLTPQIAKAYLAGTDSAISTRTWQEAMDALIGTKKGANQRRWQNAANDQAFKLLLPEVTPKSSIRLATPALFLSFLALLLNCRAGYA
jgi:hypothetical protein